MNLQCLCFDAQDKKADLCIHTYVDDVMRMLMARLELDIPEYDPVFDPVKQVENPTLDISFFLAHISAPGEEEAVSQRDIR